MNGELSVALDGAILEVMYGKCGCPPGLSTPSSGPTFALALQTANALSKGAPSNMAQVFANEDYEALPLPAGWLGRLVLIAPISDTVGPFLVRLTYEDTTDSIIPLQGLLLLETDRSNPITEVAVKGSATIGWLVTGQV